MNVALWLLAGGLAGWVGFSLLHANAVRGLYASILIGMGGGFLGGGILAPMIGDTATMPEAINLIALIMALAFAAVCLTVGDMIYRRFHV